MEDWISPRDRKASKMLVSSSTHVINILEELNGRIERPSPKICSRATRGRWGIRRFQHTRTASHRFWSWEIEKFKKTGKKKEREREREKKNMKENGDECKMVPRIWERLSLHNQYIHSFIPFPHKHTKATETKHTH